MGTFEEPMLDELRKLNSHLFNIDAKITIMQKIMVEAAATKKYVALKKAKQEPTAVKPAEALLSKNKLGDENDSKV